MLFYDDRKIWPGITFHSLASWLCREVAGSGDVVIQKQPVAMFDTRAQEYAMHLSERLYPNRSRICPGEHCLKACKLLPDLRRTG